MLLTSVAMKAPKDSCEGGDSALTMVLESDFTDQIQKN